MIGDLTLTADCFVTIKDDNGNALGSVKLDTDGSLLLYPSGYIEVSDNPLVVTVKNRRNPMSTNTNTNPNNDGCAHCACRGRMDVCKNTACSIHDSWYVKTLRLESIAASDDLEVCVKLMFRLNTDGRGTWVVTLPGVIDRTYTGRTPFEAIAKAANAVRAESGWCRGVRH
jgi:hypothetical protein